MNVTKTYRIFNLILLVIFILLLVLLFIRTRNVSLLFIENLTVFNKHYLYIVLLLIIGIIFYLTANRLSKVLWLTLKNNEKLVEEIAIQTIVEEEKHEEITDKKDYVKNTLTKIIPPEKENKEKFSEELLTNISKELEIVVGILYIKNKNADTFSASGTYAYFSDEPPKDFETGITLAGQVAKDKIMLNLTDLPDNYIAVLSGLGTSKPNNLLIVPILNKENTIAILEIASFKKFEKKHEELFSELSNKLSETINKFMK